MLEGVSHIILMNGVLQWHAVSEVLPGSLCGVTPRAETLPGGKEAAPPPAAALRATSSPFSLFLSVSISKPSCLQTPPTPNGSVPWAWLINTQAVKDARSSDLSY